ncbi:Alpha/Beta hydrolase protein [Phakopsora pachyrhizi]|uniref:Alpha/Beta hydrolase protein n=1 Tax=Phakopsora pachyrhizi TaxID=170000 RepID=A0AAV0B7T9_PHAPC|nr:Alpha/Beta hydrolase protein [Phakopsora pachyrhizi]CAH7681783.1 Alpha/Beta hydrolase protein [Phakopsora pachyrhizi]
MISSIFLLTLLALFLNCVNAAVKPLIKESFLEPQWLSLPPTPTLPGNPTGKSVLINGADIWYAEFGNVHSKEVPVLLLHGGLGNSDYYGSLIPLISRERRIIAMDTRGHGRSTMDERKLTFELYASDATGLLKHLDIQKAAFVGWSHAGVGTIAAMMGPKTSSFVERAFLYGAYSNVKANSETYTDEAIFKKFYYRAISEYKRYQPDGDLEGFITALITLDSSLPLYTASDLAKIKLGNKVTICFGEHDEAIKHSEFENLSKMIVGSKKVIIKNASHFGIIQNPEAVAKELNIALSEK